MADQPTTTGAATAPVFQPVQRVPVQTLQLRPPYKGKVTKQALNDQQPGTVYDSRDFVPFDGRTGRSRLSVRPGYSAFGSLANVAGFALLGSAYSETGGVQLFAMTASAVSKWTGSAWSNVGSITTSASRTIHAAGIGTTLYIACNNPYKKVAYNGGSPTIATYAADTAGTIPSDCRLICAWNSRIVLAADPSNPHVINFSRVDDPFDWDFTQEDNGTALSDSVDEAITCIFLHTHDCLVVGTKSGMWVYTGNPSQSGTKRKFAFSGGPVNSTAWCKTADDYTYFISHNGLYKMAPGCGSPPEEVSRNLIPGDLIGIDGTNTTAVLVYDERFRGIQIHCQGTNAQSWFYDVDGGGFWKITAPGTSVLAAYRFGLADSVTASGALVATSSNVMRLDSATALGGASAAYATILMGLSPLGQKMLIQNGTVLFGENTDDTSATVDLCAAQSPVDAVALTSDRKDSITIVKLQGNHNNWCMPRVGGQAIALKITQGDTSKYISLEGAAFQARSSGRERG